MSIKKRRWLVIAHCINMDGQAASHHVSDKLPCLSDRGITPILLSAASGKKDEVYKHHQVFSLFPSGLKFEMRHFLRRKLSNKWICEFSIGVFTLFIFPFYALEKLFLRFDSQWSWCFTGYLVGKSIIQNSSIQTIYVHGGASSAFLVAHWLSRKFEIPWIAECYDPLIHSSWNRTRSAYNWNSWVEKIICKHAKLAVWYTDGALQQAKERFPELGDRGIVVRPGMPEPCLNGITYTRGPKIRFCYFGGLTAERSLSTFLRPLVKVLQKNPEIAEKIEVHAYGGNVDLETLRFLDRHKSLKSIFNCHGRLEHDQGSGKSGRQRVNEEMRKADFLILLHGTGEICDLYIPSKAYEYLWARRPIIVTTPCPQEWKKFMDESIHFIADQNTPQALEDCITAAIRKWEQLSSINPNNQKTFSSEDAVENILSVLSQNQTLHEHS